jgi:hypothetical protein
MFAVIAQNEFGSGPARSSAVLSSFNDISRTTRLHSVYEEQKETGAHGQTTHKGSDPLFFTFFHAHKAPEVKG